MGRRAILAFVLGACAVLPASAQAGSYDVYSCKFGSSFYGNNAWAASTTPVAGDPTFTAPDTTCANPGDPLIASCVRRPRARRVAYAAGVSSALRLSVPRRHSRSPTSRVTLRHWFTRGGATSDPTSCTFVATFGPCRLAGSLGTRARGRPGLRSTPRQHWYGAARPIDSGFVTLSKADSPQAQNAGHRHDDGRSTPAACTGARARVDLSSIVTSSSSSAREVTIEDTGRPIMSGGPGRPGPARPRGALGAEPVTFSATDNCGIRRAEIVDVTDAANPAVVASEDYSSGPNTDAGTRCDYTRPRPARTSRTRRSPLRRRSRATERCSCASPTPGARRRSALRSACRRGGR